MRFITLTALLNAYLLVALPGLPSLPKLPGGPKLPDAPTYNTPSQPGREPGRLPTQNQNPQPALEPGRLPDQNQNPNAPSPEQPGRLPVPIPVVQTPPQKPKPKRPSCAGRRRAECNDESSDDESMRDDGSSNDESMGDASSDTPVLDEARYNEVLGDGQRVMLALDNVRTTGPPNPVNAVTENTMRDRYHFEERSASLEDIPPVLKAEKNINDQNNWYVAKRPEDISC